MSSMVKRFYIPLALLTTTSALVPAAAQQRLVPDSFSLKGAPQSLLPASMSASLIC